jgi:hypothetical protein
MDLKKESVAISKIVRFDSESVLYDTDIVSFDFKIVRYDPENTVMGDCFPLNNVFSTQQ